MSLKLLRILFLDTDPDEWNKKVESHREKKQEAHLRRQRELSTPQLPKKTRKRGATNKAEHDKTLKVGKVEPATKTSSEDSVGTEKKKRGRPRKNEKGETRQGTAKKPNKPSDENKKPRPRGRQQKVKKEEVHEDFKPKLEKPTATLPPRRFGAAQFTDDFSEKRNIKSKSKLLIAIF